jgi:hypothetical protein
MEYKKVGFIKAESRCLSGMWETGEMLEMLVKGNKFQLDRRN